ncbi:hypothetical protein BDP27DRAFT_1383024 [Rhodocollybia butyracea]|uniref:DH domain-containing protein n=1 Tax=Rhodocollybia butyracea TaxID=206335 RepID=A0A9P5PWP0_9AGAR|nr:hypothetical protein BDP27DRAFT_1383024 [Rhodocollybia butyracea]
MKAFFSRLHLGSSNSGNNNPKDIKEKEFRQLPPLRSWPPEPQPPQRSNSQQSNTSQSKRSEEEKDQEERESRELTPTPSRSSSTPTPTQTPDVSPNLNQNQKKVAFLSPPQTPTPAALELTPTMTSDTTPTNTAPPLKTTVSRFQATHAGTGGRASTSSSNKSQPDLRTTAASPFAASAQSLRSGAGTPYSQMSGMSSMSNSGSRILAATSWSEVTEEDLVSNLGSRERTRQEVLFEIISSEERYVQELAKMKETFIEPLLHPYSVANNNNRVGSPTLDYNSYEYDYQSAMTQSADHLPPIAARFMSPTPSLPKAKDSTPNIDGESMDTDEDDKTKSRRNHPRSPYGTYAKKSVPFPSGARSHHSLPPPPRGNASASTHSLGRQSITEQHERERAHSQSNNNGTAARGMLRKFRKDSTKEDDGVINAVLGDGISVPLLPSHFIPPDLRICLEVIDTVISDGHKRLSEALKKRYDDQFPLVRSLADVFVANSDVFQGYATFVLHLERALEQVDRALSEGSSSKSKTSKTSKPTPSKTSTSTPSSSTPTTPPWPLLHSLFTSLDTLASSRGETSLSISLSKPFQRLLKYPLLFQNLLYHTDASTSEYEATLQLVAEIEWIVRSIEDEKVEMEERDRVRDVLGRIEGLEKAWKGGRGVGMPKKGRLLVDERRYVPMGTTLNNNNNTPPSTSNGSASPPPVRGKSSFKRLSDALSPSKNKDANNVSIGGKKDIWLVEFNDVILLCQRTGTTTVPIASAASAPNPTAPNGASKRANSLPAADGKGTATTTRRGHHTKPRNLYKFVKIQTWEMGSMASIAEGGRSKSVVDMEDISRARQDSQQSSTFSNQPRIIPMPDDDSSPRRTMMDDDSEDDDSDDSDRKSKMSFSYWGADKVTVQKPTAIRGGGPGRGKTVIRGAAGGRGKPAARVLSGGVGGTPRASMSPSGRVVVVPSRRGGGGGPSGLVPSAYARESSANAKFGTRLVSSHAESPSSSSNANGHARPGSRRTGATSMTPTTSASGARSRAGDDKDKDSHKATVTKMTTRSRNTSQTGSMATRTPAAVPIAKSLSSALSSPAPSEDSGVGLYRQIIAKEGLGKGS